MDRIDALAETPRDRFHQLTGALLAREPDPVLDSLVEHAAHVLETPMAIITLVLERSQFFRAQVGLPEDLRTAGEMARDASFCQFMVRDEKALRIPDAAEEQSLPQELVSEFGVRAYAGFPVRAGGVVVGGLCGLDIRERTFDATQLEELEKLAARVSARFDELQRIQVRPNPQLIARSLAPAFAGLRNHLAPLSANVDLARVLLHEIGPQLGELLRTGLGDESVAESLGTLAVVLEDASLSLSSLVTSLGSVERYLLTGQDSPSLRSIVKLSRALADNEISGLAVTAELGEAEELLLGVPVLVAASMLSAALTLAARAGAGRVQVTARPSPLNVAVELATDLTDEVANEWFESLAELTDDSSPLRLTKQEGRLAVSIPRV